MSLRTEAALGALDDVGLKLADIDGVICAYALSENYPMLSSAFCEYVGAKPNFSAGLHGGGGQPEVAEDVGDADDRVCYFIDESLAAAAVGDAELCAYVSCEARGVLHLLPGRGAAE